MSTITNSLASYFSLNNNTSSTSTGTSNAPSLASELAAVSAGTSGSASTGSGNSFLLDLSDEAKSYLANIGNSSSTSTGSDTQDSASFVLSNAQLGKLRDVLEKYKDEPFTQDTFDQIQDDLAANGLGTDQLGAEETVRNINPTQMLLSALNGQTVDLDSLSGKVDTEALKTKSDNFMSKVIDQWKAISTTVGDATEPTDDSDSTPAPAASS
jgi:hypothetical protein